MDAAAPNWNAGATPVLAAAATPADAPPAPNANGAAAAADDAAGLAFAPPNRWVPGAFILHAAGTAVEERKRVLSKYAQVCE